MRGSGVIGRHGVIRRERGELGGGGQLEITDKAVGIKPKYPDAR